MSKKLKKTRQTKSIPDDLFLDGLKENDNVDTRFWKEGI
jgi:hypothetical protein